MSKSITKIKTLDSNKQVVDLDINPYLYWGQGGAKDGAKTKISYLTDIIPYEKDVSLTTTEWFYSELTESEWPNSVFKIEIDLGAGTEENYLQYLPKRIKVNIENGYSVYFVPYSSDVTDKSLLKWWYDNVTIKNPTVILKNGETILKEYEEINFVSTLAPWDTYLNNNISETSWDVSYSGQFFTATEFIIEPSIEDKEIICFNVIDGTFIPSFTSRRKLTANTSLPLGGLLTPADRSKLDRINFNDEGAWSTTTSQIGGNINPVYISYENGSAVASPIKGNVANDGAYLMCLSGGSFAINSTSVGEGGTTLLCLKQGKITASDKTIGSSNKPVYLNNGVITASDSTIGAFTQPVFLNGGVITKTGYTFSNTSTSTSETDILTASAVDSKITSKITSISNKVDNLGDAAKKSVTTSISATSTSSDALITQGAIAKYIQNIIYPVGSIYTSKSTTNPHDILGFGTWAQIQDRMIVGAGNKYSYGATGGAATHTLTIDEMPSHTHTVKGFNSSCDSASGRSSYGWNTSGSSVTSSSTGNGKAFSIMPPYFAVYMWYRTS